MNSAKCKMFSFIRDLLATWAAISLSGCVVIPKGNTSELLSKVLGKSSCTPIPVKMTFYEEFRHGFTTTENVKPRERQPEETTWISDFINSEAERSLYFDIDSKTPKYLIEFRTYYSSQSNIVEQALFWVTIGTLGLFPSWGHGTIQITAIVKNPDGTPVQDFRSNVGEFHTVNWLPLLPLNIGERNTNKEFVAKISPKLTDEIINQMADAHLICRDEKGGLGMPAEIPSYEPR